MSNTEKNNQISDENAPLSEDTAVHGPNAFMARKSYYFMRSLLFGFLYFLLVLAVLVMVTLIGISIWIKSCHKPISFETASNARSARLAGWLMFNQIETQPPEVREKLLKKYVNRMKAVDRKDLNSPVIVKALPYIKQLAKQYSEERSQKVTEWNQNGGSPRLAIAQNTYKIVKISEGDYILTEDVIPTDSLVQEIDQHKTMREAGTLPSYPDEPRIESNIRTLAKEWFMLQMAQYDSKPASQKAAFIADSAETLNHFSELYNKALVEMGLPVMGEIEQIRNLNYLTSGWIDTSTAEELARLNWFKDLIITASMAQRANKPVDESIEPLIRASSEKENGIFGGLFGKRSKEKPDSSSPSDTDNSANDSSPQTDNEANPNEDEFF